MGKRSIIVASAGVLLLTGVLWWALLPREPVYGGKPVSYWLSDRREKTFTHTPTPFDFPDHTIPVMDSNAVPFLVAAVNRRDGASRRLYTRLRTSMPHLVEARLPDPEPLSGIHFNAANALGSLGKDARAAVPSLIRLSKESNQADVRLSAIMALHRIDPKDSQVREALMTATHDTNSAVRTQAQMLLNTFDIFAPSAGF
jgi:hypothetical protein